jgi:hypothetical protein
MLLTNSEWVGRILDLLKEGLGSYVLMVLKREHPTNYLDQINQFLTNGSPGVNTVQLTEDQLKAVDALGWLTIIWRGNRIFNDYLGHLAVTYAKELIDYRNDWAHQHPISSIRAYNAASHAAFVLDAARAEHQSIAANKIAAIVLQQAGLNTNADWYVQHSVLGEDIFDAEGATLRMSPFAGEYIRITPKLGVPTDHYIDQPHLLVGRSPRCDIRLPDMRVSRIHMKVSRTGDGELVICDLNSATGTSLEGAVLKSGEWAVWLLGKTVSIGDTALQLCANVNGTSFGQQPIEPRPQVPSDTQEGYDDPPAP